VRPIITAAWINMVKVMVLAAGHGTRLRPLTDRLPKALVPVGDRPILTHLLDELQSQLGDFELCVNAHHGAELLRNYVGERWPSARVLVERTLLGTAGGLRAAWDAFDGEPVLIANADILARPNYRRLLQSASDLGCCLCVSERTRGMGSVGVSADGRIVRLRGETFGVEAVGGDYMGIAVIGTDAGASLPVSGCLVGDWLLPRLRRGERVDAYLDATSWSDVGELRNYGRANWSWLAERGLRSWVAPGGAVASQAQLADVIVGSGAAIETAGAFERVILWPGARLTEVVNDCVVLGDGAIVRLAT
jgi:mannose-1-phosphate guanylyltransferase